MGHPTTLCMDGTGGCRSVDLRTSAAESKNNHCVTQCGDTTSSTHRNALNRYFQRVTLTDILAPVLQWLGDAYGF